MIQRGDTDSKPLISDKWRRRKREFREKLKLKKLGHDCFVPIYKT